MIERAVIVSQNGRLRFDLPMERTPSAEAPETNDTGLSVSAPIKEGRPAIATRGDLRRIEQQAIVDALKQSHGRVSGSGGAAEILAMKPTTLYARIKRLRIDARAFKT